MGYGRTLKMKPSETAEKGILNVGVIMDIDISDSGESKELTGLDKLQQSIKMELSTIQGSDKYHPEFGYPHMDIMGLPFRDQLIKLKLLELLNRNPYISSVDNILIEQGDDKVTNVVTIYLTTINEERLKVGVGGRR